MLECFVNAFKFKMKTETEASFLCLSASSLHLLMHLTQGKIKWIQSLLIKNVNYSNKQWSLFFPITVMPPTLSRKRKGGLFQQRGQFFLHCSILYLIDVFWIHCVVIHFLLKLHLGVCLCMAGDIPSRSHMMRMMINMMSRSDLQGRETNFTVHCSQCSWHMIASWWKRSIFSLQWFLEALS